MVFVLKCSSTARKAAFFFAASTMSIEWGAEEAMLKQRTWYWRDLGSCTRCAIELQKNLSG